MRPTTGAHPQRKFLAAVQKSCAPPAQSSASIPQIIAAAIVVGCLVSGGAVLTAQTLHLVTARTEIEAGFLTPRCLYADAERIYLAGYTRDYRGALYVLARDRAAGFPTVERIAYPSILRSICGDATRLYVLADRGELLVFRKGNPLTLEHVEPLGEAGTIAMACAGDQAYIGRTYGRVAADDSQFYFAQFPGGDGAIEVDLPTMRRGITFGLSASQGVTTIFDRATGQQRATVPNPTGVSVAAPELHAAGSLLFQFAFFCCDFGVHVYDAVDYTRRGALLVPWANAVRRVGRYLIVGTEGGSVTLVDLTNTASPPLSTLDLRTLTGHLGPEDIEIRALWTDAHDRLIFAGSSWGNDSSRAASLPSFFVLELDGLPDGADLSLEGSDTPDPVAPGGALTEHFVITNGGPSEARGVTFRVTTPSELKLIDLQTNAGSCSIADGLCTFPGSIASGNSISVTATVVAPLFAEIASVRGQVSADTTDLTPDDNIFTLKTQVRPLRRRAAMH